MAVTDHDTTAALAEVDAAARESGLEAVSGIEITAVEDGRDIHVLGYLFDPGNAALGALLQAARQARIARVEAIGSRLASLGAAVDLTALLRQATLESGRSVGRPQVARALVDAGHVADTQEAFDRWLANGRPGCVGREGPTTEKVIEVIHRAGGIASLAHPGKLERFSFRSSASRRAQAFSKSAFPRFSVSTESKNALGLSGQIPALARAGLDAIEAYHPDHNASLVGRYVDIARELDLLLTGGSDFHGDPAHGCSPGTVTLPAAEFARLREARPHAVD